MPEAPSESMRSTTRMANSSVKRGKGCHSAPVWKPSGGVTTAGSVPRAPM